VLWKKLLLVVLLLRLLDAGCSPAAVSVALLRLPRLNCRHSTELVELFLEWAHLGDQRLNQHRMNTAGDSPRGLRLDRRTCVGFGDVVCYSIWASWRPSCKGPTQRLMPHIPEQIVERSQTVAKGMRIVRYPKGLRGTSG
jgi:hypothetical protein